MVFPLGDKILDECLSGERDRVHIHQSKNTKMTHETIIKKVYKKNNFIVGQHGEIDNEIK